MVQKEREEKRRIMVRGMERGREDSDVRGKGEERKMMSTGLGWRQME